MGRSGGIVLVLVVVLVLDLWRGKASEAVGLTAKQSKIIAQAFRRDAGRDALPHDRRVGQTPSGDGSVARGARPYRPLRGRFACFAPKLALMA